MRVVLAALAISMLACGNNATGGTADASLADVGGGGGDGAIPDGGGSNPKTVTLTLRDRPTNAAMFGFIVAYQDGSGPWTLAPAPSADTYTFDINAPAYGVMWACVGIGPGMNGPVQLRAVTMAHFARAERTSLAFDVPPRCTDRFTNVGLAGTLSNTGGGGFMYVQFGERIAAASTTTSQYQMEVRASTRDLFTMKLVPGANNDFAVSEALVNRGVTITAPTTRNINFATAVATQSFPVSIPLQPIGARSSTSTILYSAGDTPATLVSEATPPYETISLGQTQMVSGDVYDQIISVASGGNTLATSTATATPGAISWSPPPGIGAPVNTFPTKLPYPIVRSQWNTYANAVGYTWQFRQQLMQCGTGVTVPCAVVWTAFVSPGVVGQMPVYQMPDLTVLNGWSPRYQPISGSPMAGTLQAITSNGGVLDFPPGEPTAGTQRTFAQAPWTLTP